MTGFRINGRQTEIAFELDMPLLSAIRDHLKLLFRVDLGNV
ncbi:hypothetical protein [Sphingomonas sp. 28-62-11]